MNIELIYAAAIFWLIGLSVASFGWVSFLTRLQLACIVIPSQR